MMRTDTWGLHRVISPQGVLPQQAWQLDNTPTCLENEMLLDARALNIDSSSFHQLIQEADADTSVLCERVMEIVAERGKMHNPVTGSGGMLIGRVRETGKHFPNAPRKGTELATLVSLTLTPLKLDRIVGCNLRLGQLQVEGSAVLFATGSWVALPDDMLESTALSILDVCGAPALTALSTRPGMRVIVLGASGKSGKLACLAARKAGAQHVTALDISTRGVVQLLEVGIVDDEVEVDVRVPARVRHLVDSNYDLVVSCVNCPGAEPAAILCAKPEGEVIFFSMATSFSSAALVAEGLGSSARMTIGNGFVPGHAEYALNLFREHRGLFGHAL